MAVTDQRTVLELLGPSTGGIRRHVTTLSAELRERGWNVRLAAPSAVKEFLGSDTRVVDIPAAMNPAKAVRAWNQLRHCTEGVDLIHAHGLKAGWLATALPSRPPVVTTLHNVVLAESAGRSAPLLRLMEDRLIRRSEATIAVSPNLAERFSGLQGFDRIETIPAAAPPAQPDLSRNEVRAQLGIGPNDPLVVSVARLHPQKDLPTLLEAAAVLRMRHPAAKLVIVGEGPLRDELQSLSSNMGLDETVMFIGTRENAANELAAADVVVISSRWESGPFVAIEALQLARPLVSTPVGIVPELIENGVTGYLVPIGDPNALADALVHALDNPVEASEVGNRAQGRVRQRLDVGELTSRVEDVYRMVLKTR